VTLLFAGPACALDAAGLAAPSDAGPDRPGVEGDGHAGGDTQEDTIREGSQDAGPEDRTEVDGDVGPDADAEADVDAGADAGTDADADSGGACAPGDRRCSGAVLERCSAAGTWEEGRTCPLGCIAAEARCAQIVPSGGIDPSWVEAGTAPLAPTQDLRADTDTGTVTVVETGLPVPDVVFHVGPVVDCGGGHSVGVGVFSFTEIDIPDGVTVRVSGARAAAFLASGPVRIAGWVDARGGRSACGRSDCAGPGGFAGGTAGDTGTAGRGPGGGQPGTNGGCAGDEAGGGGGGSCGAGGTGGGAGPAFPGGTGGAAYLTASLAPWCGGSGGGAGAYGCGGATSSVQHGGGGGGAVSIVSAESVVFLSTTSSTPSGVNAGGGGGGADHLSTYDDGGGGGGGGGSILVEAPVIHVEAGAVLAAGGGGGAGGYNGGLECLDGSDGLLADAPAPGGAGTNRGGNGGAGAHRNGENAVGGSDGGAGGGGGAGRIRLATAPGTPPVIRGVLSPGPASGCYFTAEVGRR